MERLRTRDPRALGPYQLAGLLGSGGMGQVYLGYDSRGRAAAVKVLRPELADEPEMARRFLREAEAARSVRGDGVARVLAARTDGERQWIATEFLAGPTLEDAVRRHGPLTDSAVRALALALTRALRDIHAAGLVHRDLKPSNVVLTSDGPRIIDFGIARAEHGLTLTATGQAPATPGYAAPEQVLGQRTGPPGDVFALGAVLAFAASGVQPYEGGHVAVVQYQVVHGQPELSAVPVALREVVARCLAREPGARPRPGQVAELLPVSRRRRRAVWRRGPLAADVAERERQAAELIATAHESAGGHRPAEGRHDTDITDGRWRPSRRGLLMAAGGAVVTAGAGTVWWWPADDTGADGPPWAAEPLAEYSSTPPQPLWGPREVTAAQAPAPRVVRDLVVTTNRGEDGLTALDVRDGSTRWQRPGVNSAAGFLPLPGGTLLAVDGEGALLGLSADDGAPKWSVRRRATALLAGDGKTAYLSTADGELRAVDLATRRTRWTVDPPVDVSGEDPPGAAAGSGRLVLHDAKGRVVALDSNDGSRAWTREQGGKACVPAFGNRHAYLGGERLTGVTLDDGSRVWEERNNGEDGWGRVTLAGDRIYVMGGGELHARSASNGAGLWTVSVGVQDVPLDAPVVQGNSIWVVTDVSGAAGVTTVDLRGGRNAWQHTTRDDGRWRVVGADNRAFLQQDGALTALPVF